MLLPSVSVVIPVRTEHAELRKCLGSLAVQSYPAELIQVIVVSNTAEPIPSTLAAEFPHVVFCHEPQPGSYVARNCGVRHARGEILAFTDADCVPDVCWLEEGVRQLSSSEQCGLVGGRIQLSYRTGARRNAAELYESLTAFRQQDNIEKAGFSVTANLFTYRRLFDEIGGFREDLKSRGDAEWTRRARAQGYHLLYAPKAIVVHPARASLPDLVRKQRRVAGGIYDFRAGSRNVALARALDIAKLFRPRLRFAYRVAFRSDESLRFLERASILAVQLVLQAVAVVEYVRRMAGRPPAR